MSSRAPSGFCFLNFITLCKFLNLVQECTSCTKVNFMTEDPDVNLRVMIPKSLRDLLKVKSAREGITMRDAVVKIIDEYVADEKPPTSTKKK